MMPVVCPCFLHTGISESEQFLKGTSQIKILSPEDIEGMRVVCKVTEMTGIAIVALPWFVSRLTPLGFDMYSV